MLLEKLFRKNVNLKHVKNISASQKAFLSLWPAPNSSLIYTFLDVDARPLQRKIAALKAKGIRISTAAIIGKAAALAIKKYPLINSIIRLGRIYQREEINICFLFASGKKKDELSGLLVRNCDQLSLEAINHELRKESINLHQGKDSFIRQKKIISLTPGIFLKYLFKLSDLISYTLNWYVPALNEKDCYGSVSISPVGMFGIENALAFPAGSTHCGAGILFGKVMDKVKVINGEIKVIPIIQVGITFDHRLINAAGAAKLMKAFTKYLADPY